MLAIRAFQTRQSKGKRQVNKSGIHCTDAKNTNSQSQKPSSMTYMTNYRCIWGSRGRNWNSIWLSTETSMSSWKSSTNDGYKIYEQQINNKLMSNLQIEYGFNVPRNVIYEAFVDQMYFLPYQGKLCSTLGLKPKFRTQKEALFQCLMAKLSANSLLSDLTSILKWSGNSTIGTLFPSFRSSCKTQRKISVMWWSASRKFQKALRKRSLSLGGGNTSLNRWVRFWDTRSEIDA